MVEANPDWRQPDPEAPNFGLHTIPSASAAQEIASGSAITAWEMGSFFIATRNLGWG